jgi:hypothetical protein
MKKTAFRQPADPAGPTNLDSWVNPGAAITQAERLARLTIDLPLDLHSRFKAACAKHRTKMKDEVLRFITARTEELETSA